MGHRSAPMESSIRKEGDVHKYINNLSWFRVFENLRKKSGSRLRSLQYSQGRERRPCRRQTSHASPWRKTTVHGSRGTPHGVGRQVMPENDPSSLWRATPRHARLRSGELPSSLKLRRDESPRQAIQAGKRRFRVHGKNLFTKHLHCLLDIAIFLSTIVYKIKL